MLNIFRARTYYKMSDGQLEEEAAKFKIRGYGDANGVVNRQIIIDALLQKDLYFVQTSSLTLSLAAILISIIALWK